MTLAADRPVSGSVLDQIVAHRLVPVVVLPAPGLASGLGDALVGGGLPVAEVTLRTPYALDGIRSLAHQGDLLVGAGTVTRVEQVDVVADLGASFVVSPGFDPRIVERCWERGLTVLPGAATATEVQAAMAAGVETLKLFPAEQVGGVPLLRALAGPFPDVRFVPTGGIGPGNAPAYLRLPNVRAVGGSWMVPPTALERRRWAEVVDLVASAVTMAADGENEAAGSPADVTSGGGR